jgi:hypothetical protein
MLSLHWPWRRCVDTSRSIARRLSVYLFIHWLWLRRDDSSRSSTHRLLRKSLSLVFICPTNPQLGHACVAHEERPRPGVFQGERHGHSFHAPAHRTRPSAAWVELPLLWLDVAEAGVGREDVSNRAADLPWSLNGEAISPSRRKSADAGS